MDTVCQGLDFTFVYMDDILVASNNIETHKEHLCLLFQRLQDFGMVIYVSKCQFGRDSIDFLSHCINSSGSFPLPDKVQAISEFNQPVTIKGLQEFVGMVNFYQRFIPAAAQLMSPLFDALEGKPKTLVWNDAMVEAFQDTKRALAEAILLTHPHSDASISLTVDASDHSVGVVLQQFMNDT